MKQATLLLLLFPLLLQAQDSLFLSTDKPGTLWEDNPVSLGMKFTTANPGVITALKFYKTDNRTGDYQVSLWDNLGTKIAMVPVSTTATGWIRVPVNIPVGGGSFTIGVYNPFGRYGFRNSVYPRTKGQLSGISGSFENGNAMPGRSSVSCYYLDVVFKQAQPHSILIVNAGKDTAAIWPCDTIQVKGVATGDSVKYNWTVDNQWGDVIVSGLQSLTPVVRFKEPDSGVFLILTATDKWGNIMESNVRIGVMPDIEPYVQWLMNQIRIEFYKKWRTE